MNEKLPDGGKPIQVGDPSFVYQGVYHPIYWDGLDPYRPRVEMLVVKDGCYVYLRMYDKQDPEYDYQYRIPGGSIDNDTDKLHQAIAETNEEGLLAVATTQYSGVQYYELYKPNFVLKGGDMPLSYKGSINDVFISQYAGSYNKSDVEEKDLDDDMAKNGKFYWIDQVASKLRPEHRRALINCPFVNGAMKRILRQQTDLPELHSDADLRNLYYADYPMSVPKTEAIPTPQRKLFTKSYTVTVGGNITDPTKTLRVPVYHDMDDAITAFLHYHPQYHGQVALYRVDPLETSDGITTSGLIFDEVWFLKPVHVEWVGDVVPKRKNTFKRQIKVDSFTINEEITNYGIQIFTKKQQIADELTRQSLDQIIGMESTDVAIPGSKLYHASTAKIERFEPMSLDLGNSVNPPGWSTFCFADKEMAFRFGLMRAIQKMGICCEWNLNTNRPYLLEKDWDNLSNFHKVEFYIYTLDPKYLHISVGNDSRFPEYVFRDSGVLPEFVQNIVIPIDNELANYLDVLKAKPLRNENEMADSYYAAMLNHDYSQSGSVVAKLESAIKVGKLKPGDDVEAYMKKNGIEWNQDSFIKSFSHATSVTEATQKLSSYTRKPLTNNDIMKYRNKYPQLRHVRTGPMCKGFYWVDGDKIVAYVNTEEKSDANDVWIQALEVMPEYQGHRFSEVLIGTAVRELHATKLSVNIKNEKAINIYKQNGFHTFKEDGYMLYMSTTSSEVMEGAVANKVPANVRELFNTMNGFNYGVLVNGQIKNADEVNFARDYKTISPDDMDRYNGGGVCWDFVNYEAEWFKENGYDYTAYFVMLAKKHKLVGTHTFVLFKARNSLFWFESSWGSHQQIREFDNEKQALGHIIYELKSEYQADEFELYQYNAGEHYIGLTNNKFFAKLKKEGRRISVKPVYVRESAYDFPIMEEKYPDLKDSEFGVPSKRKFPLDTKKHVESAIKFFNYVDKEDEEELAKRLIKRMKETGLYDTVRVGEKNRLKSYMEGTVPEFGRNAKYAVSTHADKIPESSMFQSTLALAIRANHCENGSYYAFAQVGNEIYPMGRFLFIFTNPDEYQYEIKWVDEKPVTESKTTKKEHSQLDAYILAWKLYLRGDQDGCKKIMQEYFPPQSTPNTLHVIQMQQMQQMQMDAQQSLMTMADQMHMQAHNNAMMLHNQATTMATPGMGMMFLSNKGTVDRKKVSKFLKFTQWLNVELKKRFNGKIEFPLFQKSALEAVAVMEAPDDEERPETPIDDDEPTDYGDDEGTEGEEDRPPTPIDDEEDEPADDDVQEDDPVEGVDDGDRPETPIDDDDPTNYDDPDAMGDEGDDPGIEENPDETADENSEDSDSGLDSTSTGVSNNNNLVKNYSLMMDFEKLFAFTEDVSNTLESTIKAVPVQNKVLIQVSRNLSTIQNFIKEFIQFYFKSDDYQYNLYYYEVILQALKLNLSMIEEINKIED